jgi:hypothetical protein
LPYHYREAQKLNTSIARAARGRTTLAVTFTTSALTHVPAAVEKVRAHQIRVAPSKKNTTLMYNYSISIQPSHLAFHNREALFNQNTCSLDQDKSLVSKQKIRKDLGTILRLGQASQDRKVIKRKVIYLVFGTEALHEERETRIFLSLGAETRSFLAFSPTASSIWLMARMSCAFPQVSFSPRSFSTCSSVGSWPHPTDGPCYQAHSPFGQPRSCC